MTMEERTAKCSCIKTILMFFNSFLWFFSGVIIAISIWIIMDSAVQSLFSILLPSSWTTGTDNISVVIAYIILAFGIFQFLITHIGCAGTMHEDKKCLLIYIFALLLVILVESVAALMIIIFRDRITSDIEPSLLKTIKQYDNETGPITAFWDVTQQQLFDCCAVNNYTDYIGGKYFNNTGLEVPRSCCNQTYAIANVKQREKYMTECTMGNVSYINDKGCFDELSDFTTENLPTVIGIALGFGGFEIFGLFVTMCFWCTNKTEKRQRKRQPQGQVMYENRYTNYQKYYR